MSRNLSLAQISRTNSLLSEATVLNELTTGGGTRSTTAYNPYDGTTAAINTRRRAKMPIAPGWVINGDIGEESETNLWLQSEDVGNAATTKNDLTVTSNSVPAQDGTSVTAAKVAVAAATAPYFEQNFSGLTANRGLTFAAYITPGTLPFLKVEITSDAGANGGKAWFDLSKMTVGTVTLMGTAVSNPSKRLVGIIQERGMYRIYFGQTGDVAATALRVRVSLVATDNSDTPASVGQYVFIGGVDAQPGYGDPNAGRTVVGTHIVTTTTSVNRARDLELTCTLPPHLCGKQSGSLLVYIRRLYGYSNLAGVPTSYNGQGITLGAVSPVGASIGMFSGNAPYSRKAGFDGSTNDISPNIALSVFPRSDFLALTWKANEIRQYQNGVLIGSDLSTVDYFADLTNCYQVRWNGTLSASLVAARAFSQSEIALLALAGGFA